MTAVLKYDLNTFEDLLFHGFNYTVPAETIQIISNLTKQVGSPTYDKTPVFKKKAAIASTASSYAAPSHKKRKNKNMETTNDAEWEALCNFQPTKIEEKNGVEKELDNIRSFINKITDKNYAEMRNKIMHIIDTLLTSNESVDLGVVGSNLFTIASSNRYYSKNYAELYSDLSAKYVFLKTYYQENLEQFIRTFDQIDFVEPEVNYDKFCEINKMNEKRKSLATFYVNLMNNGVVTKQKIVDVIRYLLSKVVDMIQLDNHKVQVEEITENIAILYSSKLFDESVTCEPIDGDTIPEVILKIANSKPKDYKSLTNKTVFKFMDLIEM